LDIESRFKAIVQDIWD